MWLDFERRAAERMVTSSQYSHARHSPPLDLLFTLEPLDLVRPLGHLTSSSPCVTSSSRHGGEAHFHQLTSSSNYSSSSSKSSNSSSSSRCLFSSSIPEHTDEQSVSQGTNKHARARQAHRIHRLIGGVNGAVERQRLVCGGPHVAKEARDGMDAVRNRMNESMKVWAGTKKHGAG